METDPFEEQFQKAVLLTNKESFREALPVFREILELAKAEGRNGADLVQYQSYYALCMTMVFGPSREAIRLCERAVSKEFYNPDMYYNLGIVYMRCRKKGAAFRVLHRGLGLKTNHRRIKTALDKFDMRKKVLFKFLSRRHPINRWFGKIRHQMKEGEAY